MSALLLFLVLEVEGLFVRMYYSDFLMIHSDNDFDP